jgi:TolB protein
MTSAPVRVVCAVVLALALPACGKQGLPIAPAPDAIPASDSAPSWSPDGRWIAYAHTAGTVESADRAGIYVIDAQGGPPVHILTGDYGYPDWSPDGGRLVINAVNGRWGIFTITATGDSLTKLTSAWGYAAKWSPDGSTLAYQTYDRTQVYRMWLMAGDGTGARKLNPAGTESWFEPDWSPDGRRLLHVRLRAGSARPELFVMDTTGAAVQQLTQDGFEARYPVWSPDGRWIAWGSWHGTTAEL